jgi:integrase
LRWEDVDLVTGTLSVRRTFSGTEGSRPVFAKPKTAKSRRRSVKLPPLAVEALRRHRKAQEEEEEKKKGHASEPAQRGEQVLQAAA